MTASGPTDTIDRSAAASAKGPRLQRLRASLFLLQSIASGDAIQAYVAVEVEGDVFSKKATSKTTESYSEEDKNFKADGAFSFVTPAVINSVVIYIDQWVNAKYSSKLRFGLYTTVSVAKESQTARIKALNLTLPAEPIIALLRKGDFTDRNLLPCVKALCIDEYATQYARNRLLGHTQLLANWTDEEWRAFLSHIVWLFDQADEAGSLQLLVKAIRDCPHFNEKHDGKEGLIVSALLDLLDRTQLAEDYLERFVHASQLEVIYSQVAAGTVPLTDPTWKEWSKIAPSDLRSVTDKFLAVCPSLSSRDIGHYQRRTSAGHTELEALSQEKSVLALRYQIYDVCCDILDLLGEETSILDQKTLDVVLEQLTDAALARLKERQCDYRYAASNRVFIRSIVLTLFDGCYLALDGSGGNAD